MLKKKNNNAFLIRPSLRLRIETEKLAQEAQVYADKAKDPLRAGQLLAERIEDLKNEQNKRQQLLEQTSGKQPETAETSKAV